MRSGHLPFFRIKLFLPATSKKKKEYLYFNIFESDFSCFFFILFPLWCFFFHCFLLFIVLSFFLFLTLVDSFLFVFCSLNQSFFSLQFYYYYYYFSWWGVQRATKFLVFRKASAATGYLDGV